MSAKGLAVGDIVSLGGYFTRLHALGRLSDGEEIARRVGYAPWVLHEGWWVLVSIRRQLSPSAESQRRKYWHPDPNPVPQWKLVVPKTFLVIKHFHGFMPGDGHDDGMLPDEG